MRIFIPPLKTKIVLVKDWRFTLFDERRNSDLALALGVKEKKLDSYGWLKCTDKAIDDVSCPAGTVLMIDRIYIRNGAKDFDSVTFRVLNEGIGPTDARWKGARFWAKLLDVNTIECEVFKAAPALSKKDATLARAEKDGAWVWDDRGWRPPILMKVSKVDFEDGKVFGVDADGNDKPLVMILTNGTRGKPEHEEIRVDGLQLREFSSKVRIVRDLAKAKRDYAAGIEAIKEENRRDLGPKP